MHRLPPRPSVRDPRWPSSRFALLSIATSVLLALGSGPIQAQDKGRTLPQAPVTLNFSGAEIEAVARTLGTITGRQVVVDPRVKGQLTLSTERPVSPAIAWHQFLATLRLQGYAVVESAGLYKVVPETEAKLQAGAVSTEAGGPSGGQVLTQIYRLNHESAANLVPILRPLISPNNTINVNPGTNALVITDYADNLQRLGRIVAALDVANATGVEVIRLRHGIAADMATMVQRLVDSGAAAPAAAPAAGQAGDGGFRTTVLPDGRANALIVRAANPAKLALVRSLIEQLDQPAASGPAAASGNIHVVYLRNADATRLATTLRAALAAEGRGTGTASAASSPATVSPASAMPGGAGSASTASAQPSTGGQIQADPATNALIITAPEPQYRQLRAVIDQLDTRRAQVFVESLIAEVSADKAAEFGVQWQGPIGNKGDANIGLLGTNFRIGGANIISLATQAASGAVAPSAGLNFGIAHQTNGVYVLSALARFLQSSGDANVLSTPNLLTLDNEEAKIVIGQNVPFVTGQYTNNNTTNGAVNPFQTIERKDVGLTLRVRPQISENGTVKMQIYQEVSRLDPASIGSATGLITNKRSIESSVLVEDGSIVVLGGLLQDDTGNSQEKVPGLGDVPLLGHLFRSETRSRKKTNLMVFLRPVVVRDAAATEALSMGRYQQMRTDQLGSQPAPSRVVPVEGAAVLPALPGPTPATPATPAPGSASPVRP